ncbi:integrase, catalytic region, zinc finger, CCHC-type containing protein [Tanacetum coccineum]
MHEEIGSLCQMIIQSDDTDLGCLIMEVDDDDGSNGDLQMGNILILRVYYVEGLGSRGSNLYTISMADMMKSSLVYLLSKASKTKAWLWHRRLSHLNFETINQLAKQGLVKVERRNCTLVEAARTMLIFSKSLLFLWDEVVATACYTQNRPLIHTRYIKTPYELLQDRKPELKYLHVFGALCYPTNNFEDLGKLQPKANIGIFISYSPSKKAYQIYNKRTKLIMETVNVQFDELTQMASEQHGSGPELQGLTSGHISS